MIHRLDAVTGAEIGQALDLIGRHVPTGVEFGRPYGAQRDDDAVVIATPGALLWVRAAEVDRLTPVGEFAELTTWRDGAEVSRVVARCVE